MNRFTVMMGWVSVMASLDAMANPSRLIVSCKESLDDNLIIANLDSRGPVLSSLVQLAGMRDSMVTDYLSATQVCGVPMEFSKSCTGQVNSSQGSRSFNFKCGTRISGEAVVTDDSLAFNCNGKEVKPDFANGFYTGCKAAN